MISRVSGSSKLSLATARLGAFMKASTESAIGWSQSGQASPDLETFSPQALQGIRSGTFESSFVFSLADLSESSPHPPRVNAHHKTAKTKTNVFTPLTLRTRTPRSRAGGRGCLLNDELGEIEFRDQFAVSLAMLLQHDVEAFSQVYFDPADESILL